MADIDLHKAYRHGFHIAKTSAKRGLVSRKSILVASTLGTPLAGGILIAWNLTQFGKRRLAIAVLLASAFGLAIPFAVTCLGYDWNLVWQTALGSALNYVTAICINFVVSRINDPFCTLGDLLVAAVKLPFTGLLVGLLFLPLAYASAMVGVAAMIYWRAASEQVDLNEFETVHLQGIATRTDAEKLGSLLEFPEDKNPKLPATIILDMSEDTTVISFIMQDDVWKQSEVIESARSVGEYLRESYFENLHSVRIMDTHWKVMKVIPITRD